jgi:hypothetical protein
MPISTAGLSTYFDSASGIITSLSSNSFTAGISSVVSALNETESITLETTLASASSTIEVTGSLTSEVSTSETLFTFLSNRITVSQSQQDVHIERIIVLDDAKNVYLSAIERIDRLLLGSLNDVNDTINAVNDAYQARIDSGCRTDLFWRLVDIQQEVDVGGGGEDRSTVDYSYVYECTRINPGGYPSVGQPPENDPFAELFGVSSTRVSAASTFVGVSTTTVDYVTGPNGEYEEVPLDSLFGFQAVDLYGLKLYDEPYTRDIGDTFVTSFIGTCGVGTNFVVAMTTLNSSAFSRIQPGQLLTCDKPNVLASDAYVITGVTTTIADLTGISTASSASGIGSAVVPKIILDDTTLLPADAPEDNGNYVTFTVLVDPDTLGDLSIGRNETPYVPQTIKCPMTLSDVGKGVRVEFDNSGAPSGADTWNQFLEGELDPDAKISGGNENQIRREIERNRVREPNLGAGKVFHKLGFRYAPVVYTGTNGQYRLAKEGETVILRSGRMGVPATSSLGFSFRPFGFLGDSAGVELLPDCSSSTEETINTSITTSSSAVNGLSSTTIQDRLGATNMLRQDLSDINIRIWSERQLLGDAIERQGTYEERTNILNALSSIIDGE